MTNPKPANMAASVRQRLLNLARSDGRAYNELLQYQAMERFLYRLSYSPHSARFILKVALMLRIWGGPMARATRDIDVLGRGTYSGQEFLELIRECLTRPVAEDGLTFDLATLQVQDI